MPTLFLFRAAIHRQFTLNERGKLFIFVTSSYSSIQKTVLKFQPQRNKQNNTKNII